MRYLPGATAIALEVIMTQQTGPRIIPTLKYGDLATAISQEQVQAPGNPADNRPEQASDSNPHEDELDT